MSKTIIGLLAFGAACGPTTHHGNFGNGSGDVDAAPGGLTIDAPACATSVVTAEKVALDIYVMLDQSGSMDDSVTGGTKWTTVTSSLNTFMGQPGLDGVSVGLGYFGMPDSTGFGDSCNAADYAVPDVEIAPLPQVATQISSSMPQHSPTTATPTSAALQGAIDHAKTWAGAHPGDATVVILATDGDPSECQTNISQISAIAAAGFNGTPKIPTYVIGVGNSLANLNAIASAGGSTSAFLVDTGGNVNQQFLQAMNDIRHAALGCTYSIPMPTDGSMINYNEVNIIYQPGNGGPPVTLPYVMNKASCPATGNAEAMIDFLNTLGYAQSEDLDVLIDG
jgi:hypothetical protein